MNQSDIRELLEHSFQMECSLNEGATRTEFLASHVFGFTTYDGQADELFVGRALEVCAAISDGTTFSYIEDPDRYWWYLIMVNMPFFADRLNWGASIRGAWWDHEPQTLETCGFWKGEEQTLSLSFTLEEWLDFIRAMVEFAKRDGEAAGSECP
jgi:hypothetical protein